MQNIYNLLVKTYGPAFAEVAQGSVVCEEYDNLKSMRLKFKLVSEMCGHLNHFVYDHPLKNDKTLVKIIINNFVLWLVSNPFKEMEIETRIFIIRCQIGRSIVVGHNLYMGHLHDLINEVLDFTNNRKTK